MLIDSLRDSASGREEMQAHLQEALAQIQLDAGTIAQQVMPNPNTNAQQLGSAMRCFIMPCLALCCVIRLCLAMLCYAWLCCVVMLCCACD